MCRGNSSKPGCGRLREPLCGAAGATFTSSMEGEPRRPLATDPSSLIKDYREQERCPVIQPLPPFSVSLIKVGASQV